MYRFNGNKSFMSNGYVIWREGLGDPRCKEPNFFAVRQGETYVDRMFYLRSLDERASFGKFVSFLESIQKKEEIKEQEFLNLKLQKMRQNPFQKQRIEAVQKAIDAKDFGAAYTLLLNLDQDLEDLKEEYNSGRFNNQSHMNRFWKAQFSDYLKRALEKQMEIQDHKLVKKIGSSKLTIGELVDNWMLELLNGSDGAIIESLNPIREKMKSELLSYLKKAGIQGVESYADDIFGTGGNFTSLSGFKTTKNRKEKGDKEISSMSRLIADKIGNAVGKGMPQEILVTSEQGRGKGTVSFNTGTFYKKLAKGLKEEGYSKVYQKADVTSFEVFNTEYDIGKIAEDVFERDGFNQDAYKEFVKTLEEASRQNGSQIFQVNTNVKGYRSKRDLIIEGEGTFKNRTKNLIKMAEEAEGIPKFSMEKLVFMLNNTVDGCIADDQIDGLINYLAAVCAAWMWDDYTELFSVSESESNIKKIRMFNSGGIYYSASQIFSKTLEELMEWRSGPSFVNIEINPPKFDANDMYESLREEFPVPFGGNKAEWQAALKPRWDRMRDYVSSHGTMSIKFVQQGLEKIVDKLSSYL